MNRRALITMLGSAAGSLAALAARAQQPAKMPTIGFLGSGAPATQGHLVPFFVQRLRELGWIENRNLAIEYRWAEGRIDRGAELLAELVRLKVDVIVMPGGANATAAKQATSVIPIVFAGAGDPVGMGLVASLARPGGNLTGLSMQTADVAGKRLELLREVVPDLRHLAIVRMSALPALRWSCPRSRPRPASSGSTSPRWRSGGRRISRRRSTRSKAAPMRFTLAPTRSRSPTGFASTPSRSAHGCRPPIVSASMSRRRV